MIARSLRFVAIAVFAGSLVPLTAWADPVPQEYIDGEYSNCMSQSANTAYTRAQRDGYCRCTAGEFAKLDFDRYLVINGEVLENRVSPETAAYLEGVHAACAGELAQ